MIEIDLNLGIEASGMIFIPKAKSNHSDNYWILQYKAGRRLN
ncbi:hypothetical protein AQPE_4591 [Aquipluma nitroreducens]|uniref:Uncharacterized protein n=1 Tax=Aquipluma nitroreducens TaxID=2010828 RepID=A0A5K7SFZ4_9BACT|nr:hypothetical protein AQPE_4591 [Aquipluma nitroreducens]